MDTIRFLCLDSVFISFMLAITMINSSRIAALSLALMLCAGSCLAADQNPVGEWLVKDKTAHIRIVACHRRLWGVISWLTVANEKNTDKNNPEIARRSRPILGLPILLGMQPGDGD